MAEVPRHPAAASPVAVIGLACRFPDADDPPTLLDTILAGRRAFRRLPPARLDLAAFAGAEALGAPPGDAAPGDPAGVATETEMTSRNCFASHGGIRAGLIEGWRFDSEAFRIPAPVCAATDPAHWLALETAARALAAAGFPGGVGLDRDRIGVIIGTTLAGEAARATAARLRWPYVRRVLAESLFAGEVRADRARKVLRHAAVRYLAPLPRLGETAPGGMAATIPAGISSYFGFRGGGHAVDGACGSSLQAVASACAALAAGDIDVALAGGVDVSLDPLELIWQLRPDAAADGEVRIYDENPTGYLPGEGCGVVVLMRAAQARAAGLPVYAEIAGWGTSAGGMPGDVASDASSQLLALRRAYERAGADPCDVQFIEGHGGGTQAGDEAELTALAQLRAGAREAAALGSIKANIGHARAAAGAAGLIKTVLAMSTGVIPPSTGIVRPHQLLREDGAGFWLPDMPEEWPAGGRLAGVSAMGVGGVNVHLVLRSAPGRTSRHDRVLRVLPRLARAGSTHDRAVCDVRPAEESRRPAAFLLHGADRRQVAASLSRVAQVARWLSDAELTDLACQLGRDARIQGPVRVAIVASHQEELARLAADAWSLLPGLSSGLIATRPGIFAADNADGRITLLLSDEADPVTDVGDVPISAPPRAAQPTGTRHGGGRRRAARSAAARPGTAGSWSARPEPIRRALAVLRWLESLDVCATAAVGHGLGEIAGLAWAGVLSEADVTEIAALRAEFLSGPSVRIIAPAGRHAGDRADVLPADPLALLRAAVGQFRFGPPRRRLISTRTGRELASASEVIDLICGGFTGDDRMSEAVAAGAQGATLLVETGPGRLLTATAARTCRVPSVAIETMAAGAADVGAADTATGIGTVAASPPTVISAGQVWAGAALFAAGAIGQVQPMFSGRQSRPIDIWRDQVFIASPGAAASAQEPDSPAEEATEPTRDAPVPAQEAAALSGEAAAPTTQRSAVPPQRTAAPARESAAPAQGTAAPARESAAPAAVADAPAPRAAVPAQESAIPPHETAASSGKSTPASEERPAGHPLGRLARLRTDAVPPAAGPLAAPAPGGDKQQAADDKRQPVVPRQTAASGQPARSGGSPQPGAAPFGHHRRGDWRSRLAEHKAADTAGTAAGRTGRSRPGGPLAILAGLRQVPARPTPGSPAPGSPTQLDPTLASPADAQAPPAATTRPERTRPAGTAPTAAPAVTSRPEAADQLRAGTTGAQTAEQPAPTSRPEGTQPTGSAAAGQSAAAPQAEPARSFGAAPTAAPGVSSRPDAASQPRAATAGTQPAVPRAAMTRPERTRPAGAASPGARTGPEPGGQPRAVAAPAQSAVPPAASLPQEPLPMDPAEVVRGAGGWVRCFTQELRPTGRQPGARDDRPWRVHVSGGYPYLDEAEHLFAADPKAERTLAVIGDLAAPGAMQVALRAAREALVTGRLVAVATTPGLAGFLACLHAEHPALGITVLRVPATLEGLRAARRLASTEPGEFRELVVAPNGSVREPTLTALDLPGGDDFPLGQRDVVLVSRDCGGAALALAQVLACSGTATAVIGPASADDGAVVAGLEELRQAGARIAYEVVDTASPTDMLLAVQRIESRLGPVTAVAHAAVPGPSTPFADLSQQTLGTALGAGRAALHDLLRPVRAERLRLMLTFGSVAGRYGLPGQAALAAASAALADQAEVAAARIPGCRALHVELPGWSGDGLGQPAGLAQSMAASGTAAIGVEDAARLLLKLLATRGLPGRVAVHGRVGAPGPAHAGPPDENARRRVAGRFLAEVMVHYPGIELVCDARLSLATDPYLADYRVDGLPVLPPAMAIEALAEAASAVAGRPLRHAVEVRAEASVVLPAASGEARIRVCALADGGKITTVLRCEDSGFAVDHVRANFPLDPPGAGLQTAESGQRAGQEDPAPGDTGIADGAELYGPVCFQSGRFRRIAILSEVTSRSCRALARGAEDRAWFRSGPPGGGADGATAGGALLPDSLLRGGLLLGSPGLNDAALQVLQACVPDRRVWLAGCESVAFSGQAADGPVEIRATARTERAGADLAWDVHVTDSAGQTLAAWRGARLREDGLLPRNAAWPPSLLSVYLERGAVGLGLDPGLRIAVHCGSPAGPDQTAASGGVPRQRDGDGPVAVAAGTYQLAGFTLEARGAGSAACGWAVADPRRPAWPDGRDGLAAAFSRLGAQLSESAAATAARRQAVAACLAMAGARPGAPVALTRVGGDGWAVLEVAAARVACTVLEISGVALPVAVAIATGRPAAAPAGPGSPAVPAARTALITSTPPATETTAHTGG